MLILLHIQPSPLRDLGLAQGVSLCFYNLSAMKDGEFLPNEEELFDLQPLKISSC